MTDALTWQIGVWDRMSQPYEGEIDPRFVPVTDGVIRRAQLEHGEKVLDLGTGTGAVAFQAAARVGPAGHVTGVDISPEMLAIARERASAAGVSNVTFVDGRGEALPAESSSFDVVLASLSLMFVIDRAAAAREIARVLRPGGRLVAAVWAGAADCDLVRFQEALGRFAPPPPIRGVGPGSLADTAPFLAQLADAGVRASVETEVLSFGFDDFESAWETFASVTAAAMSSDQVAAAKSAVKQMMWGEDGPRQFRNTTQFIVGRK